MVERHAARLEVRDQPPDHVVEMAFLRDIERVAIVSTQRHERGSVLVHQPLQRLQILGNGALADQHAHALGKLFAGLARVRRLMVGADAGGEVAVQIEPGEKRRMPVDMSALEGRELGDDGIVRRQNAREIHELGKADHLGMVDERQQISDFQPRARGLERGRRHAGGKLHPEVHHQRFGAGQEIADALRPQHVGDLVRIADGGGDPVRQHAAVEFVRGDER